jgi:hypothetical protein
MVVAPEETHYHKSWAWPIAVNGLVEMVKLRSNLRFTRTTVVQGEAVPWSDERIPDALRKVVNYCIERGAYKPINGATAGHFAVKLNDRQILTSIRKSNFNDLHKVGLVLVDLQGEDSVIAHGFKPSVGGKSQRIVFQRHNEYDCIVHAHVPMRPNSLVPVKDQRAFECGSHECGMNTADGLQRFGALSAVYLDNHGPNVTFHRSIDPFDVIDFLETYFILEGKTGGYFQEAKAVSTRSESWSS